ncbi:MAG: glutamate mutase L [Spirochaetales bacterium]|nr:glutamate mutase L [Spirochaetales bacterium]
MKVDALLAEIGSTTTVISAFNGMGAELKGPVPFSGEEPQLLAQGSAPTSVTAGDVIIGLNEALEDLKASLGCVSGFGFGSESGRSGDETLEWGTFMACSSAAGGLRMSVHGLVMDMTARAAREAALGAGAIIKQVTAGKMRASDIRLLNEIDPNIILLAGGVDYGERVTSLYNAECIAELNLPVPLLYAGNVENRAEIRDIFKGSRYRLEILDNVYPRIDELHVDEARKHIQRVFEENIVHAPGMARIREMVDGPILPTPGAVFTAAELLQEVVGDLLVIDAGGATTDVHSVTDGSEEINRILISPEPRAKRTVEGDLGIYVNRENVLDLLARGEILSSCTALEDGFRERVMALPPLPHTEEEITTAEALTAAVLEAALFRHAGRLQDLYTPGGRRQIARGKDLSRVGLLIGTGGALTRLPRGGALLSALLKLQKRNVLLPPHDCRTSIDTDYIMAAAGVLSRRWPEGALKLMKRSLDLKTSEEILEKGGTGCPDQSLR